MIKDETKQRLAACMQVLDTAEEELRDEAISITFDIRQITVNQPINIMDVVFAIAHATSSSEEEVKLLHINVDVDEEGIAKLVDSLVEDALQTGVDTFRMAVLLIFASYYFKDEVN
jgi:hypothetical protein